MALSNTLGSYADVRRIFDSILEHDAPALLDFDSRGAAVHFRQRAYKFRRLMQNRANTSYDGFVIQQVGETQLRILTQPESSGLRSVTFAGKPDATLIEPKAEPESGDLPDELLSAALNLSRELDE